jgi:hypothetical protein
VTSWGAPHLRNAVAAAVAALLAVGLAVVLVPIRHAEPTAPSSFALARRSEAPAPAFPPRRVPTSPVAVAMAAEETPPPAPVETTTTSTAPPTTSAPPVPRPERIRALVDYPFEAKAPDWTVVFSRPVQDGLLGLTDWSTSTITVYVAGDASDQELAFTLAHEMAHALDALHLTPDERADYRTLRGIPQELDWLWEWGGSDGDFSMPAGDFAESFAVATTGDDAEWASHLGPPPTAQQQARLLELLDAE